LEDETIKGYPPKILDPPINFEKLDPIRNILGYSFFFDFVFRKTLLAWWWGIVRPQSYPKEFRTGFQGDQVSCKILNEWKSSLDANKLKGFVIIQDYFRS